MAIQMTCSGCGTSYNLKDEHAGKKLRCKQCGAIIEAPVPLESFPPPPAAAYDQAFRRDKFLVNQKKFSISEKYYVYDESGNPILFVVRPAHVLRQIGALLAGFATLIVVGLGFTLLGIALEQQWGQKGLSVFVIIFGVVAAIVATIAVAVWITPKRHIYIYSDEQKSRLLLEVLQDRKLNFINATYTVRDPNDGHLGSFKKNYLYNFFRKRWYVLNPDGTVRMLAKEDSLILSLLRRILPPALMIFIARTNFVMMRPEGDGVVGEFNRKFTLFDKYVLDMSADRQHELDRRMAVALGVLLDTGERR
jgi:uncharacterized protein YxjI